MRTRYRERPRVQDRLVAEFQCVQAVFPVGERALGARTHHRRRPAVCLAYLQPCGDGLAPCRFIPDGVRADQADAHLHAIGHGCPAIGREDDGLVATGREVSERVVLPITLEQTADQRFVVTGQRVDRALGAEQHDGGGHQCQRSEQAEEPVQEEMGVAVEVLMTGKRETSHAVECPPETVGAGQRPREHLREGPGDECSQRQTADEYGDSFERRTATDLRVELVTRQDQQDDRAAVEHQPEYLDGVAVLDESADVEGRQHRQVDQQNPPRDALAHRQGRRQQRQHEGPREAGIGPVEQILVDKGTRNLRQVPDDRGDARQKDHRRKNPDQPSEEGGYPVQFRGR